MFTEHKQLSVIETKVPASRGGAQKQQHLRQGKNTTRKVTPAACRVENGSEEGQTARKEIGEHVRGVNRARLGVKKRVESRNP